MSMQFERQIKKGVLEMLVLYLIQNTPMYGYQLIQTLKSQSQDFFILKEGTLYPILYRLEENGFATSQWITPENGKAPKKFYAITEKGRLELKQQISVWSDFSNAVDSMISNIKGKPL